MTFKGFESLRLLLGLNWCDSATRPVLGWNWCDSATLPVLSFTVISKDAADSLIFLFTLAFLSICLKLIDWAIKLLLRELSTASWFASYIASKRSWILFKGSGGLLTISRELESRLLLDRYPAPIENCFSPGREAMLGDGLSEVDCWYPDMALWL